MLLKIFDENLCQQLFDSIYRPHAHGGDLKSQRFGKFLLGKTDGNAATPHANASIARGIANPEDIGRLDLIRDLDVLVQDGAFNEVSERPSC